MAIKPHPLRRLKSPARLSGVILAAAFFSACPAPAQQPPDDSTLQTPPTAADTVSDLLKQSSEQLADGNINQAIRDASLAIQLDPHNAPAYEMRGSIYIQQKLWDRAERDYTAANRISPDVAYKYQLAQIKFLQKAYDNARPRFAALQGDPRLGDLAAYKVFLCDLLGGHEALSAGDLTALGQAQTTPSYYYCHAAWYLYHNQRAEANTWFASADHLFDTSTANLYISSLLEAQRFHPAAATFVTKDGTRYDHANVFLEETGLRTSTAKGWVTLPLDQLPDDLSGFPGDLRELITKKRAALLATPPPISLLTFTTISGKSYDQVHWSLEDTGLSVLTPDGWIAVPFAQLPSDLSPFPPDLRQTILQKRQSAPAMPTRDGMVSFITRHGKKYDQVKASVTGYGLRILTSDGWITVPFSELPEDLSPFPADWRPQILAKRQSASDEDDPFGMKLVSFTTKKGKPYDQVRASIGESGLHLLTSQGWTAVPFDQLPDDLSPFPREWREKIAAMQKLRKSVTTSQSAANNDTSSQNRR